MALEGTLQDFSLPDIFQLIAHQRKTGILTLRTPEEFVSIAFQDGYIVWADSQRSRLEDRLGNVLVKSGRISQAQLDESLEKQRQTLQRLGYILVNEEYIDEGDLKAALNLQISQKIYRLFRWKEGEYEFKNQEYVDYDREFITPIEVESILMEAMQMVDEWPIIEKKIPAFNIVFEKTQEQEGDQQVVDASVEPDHEEEDLEEDELDFSHVMDDVEADLLDPAEGATVGVKLTAEERLVYYRIDGQLTVRDIIDRIQLNEFQICKILFELLDRGLIQQVGQSSTETASEEEEDEEQRGSSWLLYLGYAAMGAFVLLSLGTFWLNPWSVFSQLSLRDEPLNTLLVTVSQARMNRIQYAVEVYYLLKGEYPETLTDVVEAGLLDLPDLRDPNGWLYRYRLTGQSFVLEGEARGLAAKSLSLRKARSPEVSSGLSSSIPSALLESPPPRD